MNYFNWKTPKPILGNFILKRLNEEGLKGQTVQANRPSQLTRQCKSKNAIALKIIDLETSEEFNFSSLSEAARGLGLQINSLQRYCKGSATKPFKGRYVIKHGESINSSVDIR